MLEQPVTDVFFDLDHTLWDFERNSELTYRRIFRDAGLQVDIPAFLQVYIPLNFELWKAYREGRIGSRELRYTRLRSVFEKLGMAVGDQQIEWLSEAYIEFLSTHTYLMPDAEDILGYLSGKYRLHIITNGFGEVQYKKLRNSRIDGYFTEVIHSERAGVKKPDPKIFRLALELAGIGARQAVMIGDSLEADILGARAVGFQTIHFNVHGDAVGAAGPVIHGLREIKSYL
ncbi:YjjG family noncanonical pyrimidine nucleotidase [Robiginitalea sp. SC105]|uniref:YjjG family noncanonical pyrimidine nucleotidase n=1 Tax=Robiginitalea sp. SC105 TaxID=2762332 RepID=UPI00163A433E|nr:YjjG family noncanonical pyrimidine nucleotidase [Robiginitalea sp. SC105]MBC2839604.1 noncanonical pyrimidine nucleotidase, YjjG family [Robiginitalea sp. SC105]